MKNIFCFVLGICQLQGFFSPTATPARAETAISTLSAARTPS
jgi:hypothetical protein